MNYESMTLLDEDNAELLERAKEDFGNIEKSAIEAGFNQTSPGSHNLHGKSTKELAFELAVGEYAQPIDLSYGDGDGSVLFYQWTEKGTEGILSNSDYNYLDQTEIVDGYKTGPRIERAQADVNSVKDETAIAKSEIQPKADLKSYRAVARTFSDIMDDIRYD